MGYSKYIGVAIFVVLLSLCFLTPRCFAQSHNLDYFVGKALDNSPLLHDLDNQAAANGIDSARLRAAFRPQVTGIAANSVSPVIGGWGYDAAITNIFAFNDIVNVNQSFIGKKNLASQYSAFNYSTDSLRNSRKMSEQDLKRSVTAQYITTYGDLQQLKFYTEIYDLLASQEVILKKLTEGNIYRQADYLTFVVTLKQQQLQRKQWQIQYKNDYAMLGYVCGLFDTSATELEEPTIDLQQLPDASRSVFFYHFLADSLKLNNAARIIDYSYRPRLSAFANAGYNSSFIYDAYKNFGFSAGMSVNVPIFDGHQRSMLHKKVALLQQTTAGYRNFFTRQYDQQIALLQQQLVATESLIGDINEQVLYAKGLIDVEGKLIETGDAKIADLVIAVNNYLTARNLLAQNNITRMQIINQINYWNR